MNRETATSTIARLATVFGNKLTEAGLTYEQFDLLEKGMAINFKVTTAALKDYTSRFVSIFATNYGRSDFYEVRVEASYGSGTRKNKGTYRNPSDESFDRVVPQLKEIFELAESYRASRAKSEIERAEWDKRQQAEIGDIQFPTGVTANLVQGAGVEPYSAEVGKYSLRMDFHTKNMTLDQVRRIMAIVNE